jgi:hypothetical protein
MERSQRFDETILHQVVDILVATEQTKRHASDQRSMATKERFARPRLAGTCGHDQRRVRRPCPRSRGW